MGVADVTASRRGGEDLATIGAMTQMPTPSPQPSAPTPMQVGPHELSVVGVVAISRTAACTRYAKDADRAPQMRARVELLRMSAWQVSSFDRVVALASAHGIDAAGAAERFTDVLGDFDERLRPLDWAERLVKTYIAFGLLIDFGMALSDSLTEPLRGGLIDELGEDPISSYAVAELEAAISADPQLAARLGLWCRRVVGEEIGTFQRLLGQFPELLGSMGPEQLHTVLSQGAVSRMKGLGLRV